MDTLIKILCSECTGLMNIIYIYIFTNCLWEIELADGRGVSGYGTLKKQSASLSDVKIKR